MRFLNLSPFMSRDIILCHSGGYGVINMKREKWDRKRIKRKDIKKMEYKMKNMCGSVRGNKGE
jgi:hypothetical protein